MGAEFLDEWRNVRLGGEAIRRLAELPEERDLPPISAKSAEMDGAQSENGPPAELKNPAGAAS